MKTGTKGPRDQGTKPGAPGPGSPRTGLRSRGGGLDVETWETSNPDAAGFVLAGGQSSRMGSDKVLVEFRGRPLVEQAIAILEASGLLVHIAGAREENRSRLESYAPVIFDREPGLGPLAGVCAALRSTSAAYSVFLPVDLPLLPPSLILYLLHHARITASAVTVASLNAFAQTFPAVIARQALPVLERKLGERELGCLAALQAAAAELGQAMAVLPVEILVQCGQVEHADALPPVRWYLNVNSARDLRMASSVRTVA